MKKVLIIFALLLYMTFPMTVSAKDIYKPVEEVDPKEQSTYLNNFIPENAWIYIVVIVAGAAIAITIHEKRNK